MEVQGAGFNLLPAEKMDAGPKFSVDGSINNWNVALLNALPVKLSKKGGYDLPFGRL